MTGLLLGAVTMLLLVSSTARTSHAAGTYSFCPRWAYTYVDQNLGEDNFVYTGAYGIRAATNTWAELQKDGIVLWAGFTGTNACTPPQPAVAGNYTLWVTSSLHYAGLNVQISIFPIQDDQWRWFSATWSLSNLASGHRNHWVDLGAGDTIASAAAIAVGMIDRQDGRFARDKTITVYTEVPDFVADAGNFVRLGKDEYTNGNWVAYYKSVVAHELGHMIQQYSFGYQAGSYNDVTPVAMCNCDHIVHTNIRSHCMQSREHIGAAQREGFAHFHGADLFNLPGQEDAVYPYYKEFLSSPGNEIQPPVALSAYYPSASWHWMEAWGCAAANRGTEIDWLNFFYQVKNKGTTGYSFGDIARAYRDACGGLCDNTDVTTWTSLQNAVNARFGASSAKALYWAQIGDWQGVNW